LVHILIDLIHDFDKITANYHNFRKGHVNRGYVILVKKQKINKYYIKNNIFDTFKSSTLQILRSFYNIYFLNLLAFTSLKNESQQIRIIILISFLRG